MAEPPVQAGPGDPRPDVTRTTTSPALRTLAPALLAALALATAGPARAQDAGAGDVGDGGAAAIVSPTSNALVAIRRSEPRSELALSVGATVVDSPAIPAPPVTLPPRNGLQRGALELEGSWAPVPTLEVFTTLNALAFRWLLVSGPAGPQSQSQARLGAMTVGATWVPLSLPGRRLDAGGFLRVLLPTSNEVQGVRAWGFQPGLTFRGVALPWLAWFGGVSFRASWSWGGVATPAGVLDADMTLTGTSATLGLAVVPSAWLRLVAQCSGSLAFQRGYDVVSPALGVRFVAGRLGADLGMGLSFGSPARLFTGVGRVTWRLDG